MYDTELLMGGFQDELTKEALLPALRPALKRVLPAVGSGAGVGSLAGAVGGGLYGGVKHYRQARREGAETGEAVGAGLAGATTGALKGGVLGAGLGAAGLGTAAAARRLPKAAKGLTEAPGAIGASARFGQRQVHGLTGWAPEGGISKIHGGSWGAAEELKKLKASPKATEKGLAKAEKALAAAQEAERRGLSSVPGYLKGLRKDPMGTIRAGAAEQWHSSGVPGRLLIYGWPAGAAATELAQPSEPGEGGRLERAGEALGMLGYGLGPMPFGAQMLMAGGMSGGLKRLGRLADRKKGAPAPPGPMEPGGGTTQPEEYVYTDRAAGNL
jgi:hypothetical protein